MGVTLCEFFTAQYFWSRKEKGTEPEYKRVVMSYLYFRVYITQFLSKLLLTEVRIIIKQDVPMLVSTTVVLSFM